MAALLKLSKTEVPETAESGLVGGVKLEVYSCVPLITLTLEIKPKKGYTSLPEFKAPICKVALGSGQVLFIGPETRVPFTKSLVWVPSPLAAIWVQVFNGTAPAELEWIVETPVYQVTVPLEVISKRQPALLDHL